MAGPSSTYRDEQHVTQPEPPPACTATIRWGGRAEEPLIRCAQPAGHYDETRTPDPYATPDSPGGWHRSTPPDVATWADRADGATPHQAVGGQPAMMQSRYPKPVGTSTMAADQCPQCRGDNTEAWALCGSCTAAEVSVPNNFGDQPLIVRYRNYRGETADRRILPISVRYGATDWHPEPQWLLRAHDFDKGAHRDFALADMQGVPDAAGQSRTTPDNPSASGDTADNPGALQHLADVADQVDAGVRAAAQVAVNAVVNALSATQDEFALTGPDEPTVASPATLADLLTHTLAEQGISQADLARRTRLSTKHINQVCKGIARISIDAAVRLEFVLGVPAAEWMRADAASQIADYRDAALLSMVTAELQQLREAAETELPDRAQAAIGALEQQVEVRDQQLAEVREYVRTSDDDGIRTREQVLRILGAAGEEAHAYLSTGCLHGEHDYCKGNTGSNGTKIPAVCKFCHARCRCACHREAPNA